MLSSTNQSSITQVASLQETAAGEGTCGGDDHEAADELGGPGVLPPGRCRGSGDGPRGTPGALNYQTPAMVGHPPIPVSQLASHIEALKASDNLRFSQEYESIDPGQQFTWEHSNLESNKPKNRLHQRNYCDGYRRRNAYIATQGPLPETCGDFWRMVWEQHSVTIVMMTKLEERTRVKCDQYWPSRGSESYGLMEVTLEDVQELATYCIRTFSLKRVSRFIYISFALLFFFHSA
ncbi:hypothetical protein MRX96_052690 [Rhipicephalus microplus]